MSRSEISGRYETLAALTFVLVLVGLLTRNGGMIVIALPLVVYLCTALISPAPKLKLKVERSVSADTLMHNAKVDVTVRVINEGKSLDEVFVQDLLPERTRLTDGKTSLLTSLPAGAAAVLKYTLQAPRGSYTLDEVAASASDHLGVKRAQVRLSARQGLLFLPDIQRLRKVAIRPARTHGHFGPIPSRQTGSGLDFFGLREYQMGDPRRWINWRSSARNDQRLFVNQFEQERIADVGIILDARQQIDIVLPDGESLFEYSVLATGALSDALLNDGNRVGLLIYGFGLERTFPGYGKVQQKRILRSLGQARTGHNFALESMGYLPTRFFPAGSQIVMISPLASGDLSAYSRLRACGYEILVVSPDPVSFEAKALKLNGGMAWEIARAERVLLLRRLQRMGCRVLDWRVDQPFEPLVRSSLSRVSVGRRMGLRGSL